MANTPKKLKDGLVVTGSAVVGSDTITTNTATQTLTNKTINSCFGVNPQASNSYDLGSSSFVWRTLNTRNTLIYNASSAQLGRLEGTSRTLPSGAASQVNFSSEYGGGYNGAISVYSFDEATANATATGTLYLETGNKTAGTGASGNIQLKTGTSAGGNRGTISFNARFLDFSNAPIGSSVTFSTASSFSFGSAATPSGNFFGQTFLAMGGNFVVRTAAGSGSNLVTMGTGLGTLPSTLSYQAGITLDGSATGNFALWSANDANASATPTRSLYFETGNKTAGTGASGDIRLRVGTSSGGARGAIYFEGNLQVFRTITGGGTTGDQTIDRPAGTVNFAAAATSLTVTNNLVTANSIVMAVVRTNDATAKIKNVVPAAGSFVINLDAAATAETSVGFFVIN